MNRQYKEPWLEALRSGRYQQGRSYINSQGRFCCLGVLCDVAGVQWTQPDEAGDCTSIDGTTDYCNLTEKGCEMFGLRSQDVQVLTRMNDSEGKSFRDIADYIERAL
jgi:hypothetical protein